MVRIRLGLAATLFLLTGASAFAQPGGRGAPIVMAGNKIADGGSYATMVELKHQPNPADNGRLILAYANQAAGIPIWESRDRGATWQLVATAHDLSESDRARCDIRTQPHITEMPRSQHGIAAGTILLSASSSCQAPAGAPGGGARNMHLRLFGSTDLGKSWNYVSTFADAVDGLPVWEPFLLILDDGTFIEYYSDETHKAENYNQMLGHKISRDGGKTWGAEIFDVAIADGVDRPGMVLIDRVPQKGFVYVYEDVSGPVQNLLYIKFSKDGMNWGNPADRGIPLKTDSGQFPMYTPSINWFPLGGPKGVLVATSRDVGGPIPDPAANVIFWNNNLGQGPWWQAPSPVQKLPGQRAGYTQALLHLGGGRILHVSSSTAPGPDGQPGDPTKTVMLSNIGVPNFNRYEAENARQQGSALMRDASMSNGAKSRLGAVGHGSLSFRIHIAKAGQYRLKVDYSDLGYAATPRLSANGKVVTGTAQALPLDAAKDALRTRDLGTRGDGVHYAFNATATLKAGDNLIQVQGGAHGLDVDFLEVTAR
jgi:hypothetical protein